MKVLFESHRTLMDENSKRKMVSPKKTFSVYTVKLFYSWHHTTFWFSTLLRKTKCNTTNAPMKFKMKETDNWKIILKNFAKCHLYYLNEPQSCKITQSLWEFYMEKLCWEVEIFESKYWISIQFSVYFSSLAFKMHLFLFILWRRRKFISIIINVVT